MTTYQRVAAATFQRAFTVDDESDAVQRQKTDAFAVVKPARRGTGRRVARAGLGAVVLALSRHATTTQTLVMEMRTDGDGGLGARCSDGR